MFQGANHPAPAKWTTSRQVGFLYLDLDQQIINLIGFVETSTFLLADLVDGIRLNPAHVRVI